jgi:hypothetical protein
MKNCYTKILISVIFLICVVMSLKYLNNPNTNEGFNNQKPGVYPRAVTMPLLEQPLLTDPGVSALGSSELWKSYPVYPASSTKNNNIRYWKTPNNGKCSRGEMCGGLYSTKYTPTVSPPPKPLAFSSERRVNFYNSHEPC